MEPGEEVTLRGIAVSAFAVGALFAVLMLAQTVSLDSLATPTPLCQEEIEASVVIFLALVLVAGPWRDILGRSRAARLLAEKVELPLLIKVIALVVFVSGAFIFAFWSIADVLGGYNGYGVSFATYPTLSLIYNDSVGLIPYFHNLDKGSQASFFFSLACLGLIVLRLDKGVWTSIKDAVTLFAAPCLVVFELELWINAPEDMTWHVTDYLWWGGVNDGGYRARDFISSPNGGGAYVFSNWLVLAVAILLVASRMPGITSGSRRFWERLRERSLKMGGGPAGRTLHALRAPLSRRHSGFCGLNRLTSRPRPTTTAGSFWLHLVDLPG